MSWTQAHEWQEAALKLRQALWDEHLTMIDAWKAHWSEPNKPYVHEEGSCIACKLLTETRWCMQYPPKGVKEKP